MQDLISTIEDGFDRRDTIDPAHPDPQLKDAVEEAISLLDSGQARVAEKTSGSWVVNEWLKKSVLLYFALEQNRVMEGAHSNFFDKVPLKYARTDGAGFAEEGVRVVPDAIVRKGSYVEKGVVLMPSYVNIGAWVGSGTLVDTWATVGSCAQIGRNVHLSGGAGIGGVLEPVQAAPTIIEDDCFIGARSEIVEGVVVEEGSVISMGVYLGQSTRIYDREKDEVSYGRIPAGSVVVSGTLPSSTGKCQLYCAVIVKRVDSATRKKTAINQLLRSD